MTTDDRQTFDLAVVNGLIELGFDVSYEYPGIVSVTIGDRVLGTALLGYSYGTWSKIVTHDDGEVWVEQDDESDSLDIDLPDWPTDVPHTVEVLAAALRSVTD